MQPITEQEPIYFNDMYFVIDKEDKTPPKVGDYWITSQQQTIYRIAHIENGVAFTFFGSPNDTEKFHNSLPVERLKMTLFKLKEVQAPATAMPSYVDIYRDGDSGFGIEDYEHIDNASVARAKYIREDLAGKKLKWRTDEKLPKNTRILLLFSDGDCSVCLMRDYDALRNHSFGTTRAIGWYEISKLKEAFEEVKQ